jgi:hypothetical protein
MMIPTPSQAQTSYYQVRIQGTLGLDWAEWFDGFIMTHTTNGDTVLAGPVADQAALYGLIARVRDLGLVLVAVMQCGSDLGSDRP